MVCTFLDRLEEVIKERLSSRDPSSYTFRLHRGGVGLMSRKVGEEAIEVMVAAMSGDRVGVINEAADLIYHLLVLLNSMGIGLGDVCEELERRHHKSSKAGNG